MASVEEVKAVGVNSVVVACFMVVVVRSMVVLDAVVVVEAVDDGAIINCPKGRLNIFII